MGLFSLPGQVTSGSLVDLAKNNSAPPVLDTEKNWIRGAISGLNWNKLYPYQLLITVPSGNGSYTPMKGLGTVFTLPIPPQALSISTPFAIDTSVGMDSGIIEQHNGAPIRMIHLSGTFGVVGGKTMGGSPPATSFPEAVFAGTIAQAKTALSGLNSLKSGSSFTVNAYDVQDFDVGGALNKLTGFYQFRLLQQFFDYYAELKKTKSGRTARLAFAIYKDEAVYLCSPVNYTVNRGAGTPLEYQYDLTLKASKRVKLNTGVVQLDSPYTPVTQSADALRNVLATMAQAQLVLSQVDAITYEAVREVSLFCKDALSIPVACADLADSIINTLKTPVLASINGIDAINSFKANYQSKFGEVDKNLNSLLDSLGQLASEVAGGVNNVAATVLGTHPANNPFDDPVKNFKFFSSINIGSLKLAPTLVSKIARERDRVSSFTRLDFQKRRDVVYGYSVQYANSIGLGDPAFDALYGQVNSFPVTDIQPTSDQIDVLFTLNDVIMQLDGLAATGNQNDANSLVDSISSVAGMANRAGIAFKIPVSKYAVPYPYAYTLELLAYKYLGDPNRWFEIAALNGLQAPYVDEEGFDLPLLANGFENKISVDDDSLLYIGQSVWLISNSAIKELRHITQIDKINDDQIILTLDGALDLSKFTTIAGAVLHAYLPNTVNSQQSIYIPSDREPQENDYITRDIPGLNTFDNLIKVGGIDWLLTPNNDIVIDSSGNTQWSSGLVNIIQKIRLAISVQQGHLLGHPTYGLPISVGQVYSDFNKQDLLRSLQTLFQGDNTFNGVDNISIKVQGPATLISMGVNIAGVSSLVPVSATLV